MVRASDCMAEPGGYEHRPCRFASHSDAVDAKSRRKLFDDRENICVHVDMLMGIDMCKRDTVISGERKLGTKLVADLSEQTATVGRSGSQRSSCSAP